MHLFILAGVENLKRENKTALMKAADLLLRQEQSSKVLRRKLLSQKYSYSESEVDSALKVLQEKGYLNDNESCTQQFEFLYSAGELSVNQICVKLVKRGFDSDFIKSLIPTDSYEHDKKIAARLVEKFFMTTNFSELDAQSKYKFKGKVYQKLFAKGFSSEIISATVEDFCNA